MLTQNHNQEPRLESRTEGSLQSVCWDWKIKLLLAKHSRAVATVHTCGERDDWRQEALGECVFCENQIEEIIRKASPNTQTSGQTKDEL